MKKILAFICLTLLFINYVKSIDEETENKYWAVRKDRLEKLMKEKETAAVELTEQDQVRFDQSHFYKNKMIEKLQSKSIPVQELQNVKQTKTKESKFASFLSVDRVWMDQDDPKRFFLNTAYTTNINSIPSTGFAGVQGWSGSYWPMRNGGISVRYNKNEKNTIGAVDRNTGNYLRYYTWSESVFRYSQPSEHKIYSANADFARYVDENYSAAEKYDLLVGDLNYTLTNYMKNDGKKYAFGNDVTGWFGICHGWAPASFYFSKPQHEVNLLTQNGMNIRFLPDDIKALTSLFFANASFKTLFVGNRCEYYYPNPGWFSSPNCLSLNAGTFIIVLGNHVGRYGKNLIYEPSADPEIWNEPLRNYSFRYYNVFSNKFSPYASSVKTPMNQLRASADPYLNYVAKSNPKATYAVGVFVKTTHTLYTQLTDLVHDNSTAEDKDESMEYDAILELDDNDNILGGEWKHKEHPNFIWYWDESTPIEGISDKDFPSFVWTSSLPDLATKASSKGQPLKAVVNFLVNSAA
jgi:hypothetical protein